MLLGSEIATKVDLHVVKATKGFLHRGGAAVEIAECDSWLTAKSAANRNELLTRNLKLCRRLAGNELVTQSISPS